MDSICYTVFIAVLVMNMKYFSYSSDDYRLETDFGMLALGAAGTVQSFLFGANLTLEMERTLYGTQWAKTRSN